MVVAWLRGPGYSHMRAAAAGGPAIESVAAHGAAADESLNSPAVADGGLCALIAAFEEAQKATDAVMGDWDKLREL